MIDQMSAKISVSIEAFIENPAATLEAGQGCPIEVWEGGRIAFYCVPKNTYETMMNVLEDVELNQIADEREGQKVLRVNLDDA